MFEIIVVDNDSSDTTSEVVQVFSEKFCNVRYAREPRVGLSHARNRGMLEASGDYVAYIDDDAEAFPDWVEQIIDYSCKNPSVVAFGGPYCAFTTEPLPDWFPPEYGSFTLGERECAVNARTEFLCGTNMVFRRDILAAHQGFNSALGMAGSTVAYGEETRLQIDLKHRGYEVCYVPGMAVKHLLPAYKMSLCWLLRSVYANGRCSAVTFDSRRTLRQHLKGCAYGVYFFLSAVLRRRKQPIRRLVYYSLRPLISECGALVEFFSRRSRNQA